MTYAMFKHYSAPPGFDVDAIGRDAPITEYNVNTRMNQMLEFIAEMKMHYRGNHILVPMGDDFRYEKASINFDNMDRLIKEFHHDEITLLYSTPSHFISEIQKQHIEWPTNYDDMFPYADHPDAFWSGYFSSRANSKEFIRKGSHNLHAESMLYAMDQWKQFSLK